MNAGGDSVLRRFVRDASVLIGVAVALVVAVLVLPPWWGPVPYAIHTRTGIPYIFGWPPRHFTGVWRDYVDGVLHAEFAYQEGQWHGVQKHYDRTGKEVRRCEYRNHQPWSGVCEMVPGKTWLAEYRDGHIWTGAVDEETDTQTWNQTMRYYFKGSLRTEAEFRDLMGFGPGGSLIGIMRVR